MLNFTKTELLGLDIGSYVVKAVRLRKDDTGYTVTAAGISEIAVSEEDNNHQKINTVKAIRECLESTGRKMKLAVCGLSGPEVAVRDFEFPSLSTSEIEGAVLFEASQVCPFNAADSAVDYHLIPNGDDKTRGILVAATNAKSTTAILNVGGSGTTVAIMGGNGRPFIRDMTFAGDNIIKQIATDKGMSTEDVKGILSGDSTASQIDLNDSLEKACQKLIVDVSKTLRYYATQEQSRPVEKIFVCGGFALTKGFIELLNSQLGAETVLWNPFEKMRCDTAQRFGDICNKKGPALAVAAGLAMRSV
jgi:type IV pilus assembly protein PilM